MSNKEVPKITSYEYGEKYQQDQVIKHINRKTNHWKNRVLKAHELVDKAMEYFPNIEKTDLKIIDVGCSIGTIAIEMAARGHIVYGVDFDQSAINIAKKLCDEDGLEATFLRADVSDLNLDESELFDIAMCFDIFEHLHDDELGSFLNNIKKCLKNDGLIVFYTYPLQYDYLFYSRWLTKIPLGLLNFLPEKLFLRFSLAYASLIDAILLLLKGQTYRDRIKKEAHCNPTTPQRLTDIFKRSGYKIELMETGNIYPFQPKVVNYFKKHEIAHRQLWGIASKNI